MRGTVRTQQGADDILSDLIQRFLGRKLVGIYTGTCDAEITPKRLHKNLPCDFVIMSVRSTNDNSTDSLKAGGGDMFLTVNDEVYWGLASGGQYVGHQIFPAETTDFIPVGNARDILVRQNVTKGGSVQVIFSCFKYEELEQ